jgi:hypothetical protein
MMAVLRDILAQPPLLVLLVIAGGFVCGLIGYYLRHVLAAIHFAWITMRK